MKLFVKLCLMITLMMVIAACSKDKDAEPKGGSDEQQTNEVDTNDKNNGNNEKDNSASEADDEDADNEAVSGGQNASNKWGEDQLELSIGDTGEVSNNFSKFEVTMHSVTFMEKAGDELPQGSVFALIDLTIKNTGDSPFTAEEILSDVNLTEVPGTGGTYWFYIDGVAEEWPGKIEPNESKSGVVLFDITDSNHYALQFGHNHETVSNEVRFNFTPNEAKQE